MPYLECEDCGDEILDGWVCHGCDDWEDEPKEFED